MTVVIQLKKTEFNVKPEIDFKQIWKYKNFIRPPHCKKP